MKDLIHALKYDRRRTISPRLGAAMKETAASLLHGADCVVPVPLHPRREYVRGFNQARDLALQLGPPVREPLARMRHTRSQIDLPKDRRRANVDDAFAWREAAPGDLERAAGGTMVAAPRVVVLVDDVSTTGATLESCARVLKAAGVTEVRAVTAARVVTAPR